MKTIVLANHKGGCAKTTAALNIAVTLAASGSRVLAVDLDPQGNLSAACGIDLEELEESRRTALRLMLDDHGDYSEYMTQVRPRMSLIPCCLDDEAEAVVTAADSRELLLKEKLEPALPNFDYCVIDTPPSLGILTLNALAMSDLTIVPIDTGLFPPFTGAVGRRRRCRFWRAGALAGAAAWAETDAVVLASSGGMLIPREAMMMIRDKSFLVRCSMLISFRESEIKPWPSVHSGWRRDQVHSDRRRH